MPYTPQHKYYLEAMGIVPWVQRCVVDIETDPIPIAVPIENAGNCSLLLMFENTGDNVGPDLNDSDNRLLLDMLKAIELSEELVARRQSVLTVSADPTRDVSKSVANLITPSVKAVVFVVTQADSVSSDEAEASRLVASAIDVPVWQLPHPNWIRQQPSLKRRAWNVLKAVRENLSLVPE